MNSGGMGYQYGNSSPELAEEIADALEAALGRALDGRDKELEAMKKNVDEILAMISEIRSGLSARVQ
jgi:hypothetical protein